MELKPEEAPPEVELFELIEAFRESSGAKCRNRPSMRSVPKE